MHFYHHSTFYGSDGVRGFYIHSWWLQLGRLWVKSPDTVTTIICTMMAVPKPLQHKGIFRGVIKMHLKGSIALRFDHLHHVDDHRKSRCCLIVCHMERLLALTSHCSISSLFCMSVYTFNEVEVEYICCAACLWTATTVLRHPPPLCTVTSHDPATTSHSSLLSTVKNHSAGTKAVGRDIICLGAENKKIVF